MIRIFLVTVITGAVVLAAYLFFYLGFYKGVNIITEKRGPLYLIYKSHTGAYHEIGASIDEVEAWAKEHHLECAATFGEYLDNPEAVDQDRLRSHAGCVLSAPVPQIPPNTGVEYEVRPEHNYLVGQFEGSPAIGPFKVYPKMQKRLAELRLKADTAVIEIYHVRGSDVSTEYLFHLVDPREP